MIFPRSIFEHQQILLINFSFVDQLIFIWLAETSSSFSFTSFYFRKCSLSFWHFFISCPNMFCFQSEQRKVKVVKLQYALLCFNFGENCLMASSHFFFRSESLQMITRTTERWENAWECETEICNSQEGWNTQILRTIRSTTALPSDWLGEWTT